MRKGKCREHLLTRGLGEEDERELFGIEILVSDVNHGAEGFLPPVDGDDVQGGLAGEWAVSVGLYQQLWPREINVESQLQCCIGCEQTSDGSSLHVHVTRTRERSKQGRGVIAHYLRRAVRASALRPSCRAAP